MSADKHKKKQRAFAFLLKRRRRIKHDQPQQFYFSGRPSTAMRWLIEQGFAVVSRQAKGSGPIAGRNVFTEVE